MDTLLRASALSLAFALTAFQLYAAAWGGSVTPLSVRATHVGLVLALVFLTVDRHGKRRAGASADGVGTAIDLALVVVALVSCGYAIFWSNRFLFEISSFPSSVRGLDLAMGGALLVLLLEASRRLASASFALLTACVIGYATFGNLAPGPFAISPYTFSEVIVQLYTSTVGFWGEITGVSAVEIGVLVLFAGVLSSVGGIEFLKDLAIVVAGRATGGGGKVAVIMSAFFGMISGSSAANVASVGSFTIPMMIKQGYRPPFAAGLEAAASTFGQLMPPIMGTAAFIMAELLGASYTRIMVAAVIPSLAIYLAIYFATHFYAGRTGLGGLPADLIAEARRRLTRGRAAQLLLPLAVLVAALVVGFSVPTAAVAAYVTTVLVFLALRWREPMGSTLRKLANAIEASVGGLISVAVLIFAAQTLVTIINMTSLGVIFTTLVTGSALSPFLLALLVAAATLVLGMGLPTTAAYVVAASVTVPLLTQAGFPPLAAHMFVFFFAILSAITPPVCVAVYVSSAIAGAHWLKVAVECLRISLMKYLLPFLLLYNTALLFEGAWSMIIVSLIGVLLLSYVTEAVCYLFVSTAMNAIEAMLATAGIIGLIAALVLGPPGGPASLAAWVALASVPVIAMVAMNRRRRSRSELPSLPARHPRVPKEE